MRLYPRMTITVSLAHAAKSFIALNPRETISFPQIADESIVTGPNIFLQRSGKSFIGTAAQAKVNIPYFYGAATFA